MSGKIAKVYSQALYSTLNEKEREGIYDAFSYLMEIFSLENGYLIKYLRKSPVSMKEKKEKLMKWFQPKGILSRYLDFLSQKKRLNHLKEIVHSYLSIYEMSHQIKRVEVYSAFGISSSIEKKLSQTIKREFEANEVKLVFKKDKKLCGGIQFMVDGLFYDYSLEGAMGRLENYLIEKVGS